VRRKEEGTRRKVQGGRYKEEGTRRKVQGGRYKVQGTRYKAQRAYCGFRLPAGQAGNADGGVRSTVNTNNSNNPNNPNRFELQHGSTSAPMNLKKVPGLYIHIPFCRSKCGYCDFYSVTELASISGFIDALIEEMGMCSEIFKSFDTVYFGGGTPSMLPLNQIERILNGVCSHFNLLPDTENTLEANPGDLDLAYLTSLRNLGINRVNIGVQSFNEEILKFLGRRHSVGQALSALEDSRKAGFSNLGLDLIYGVPGQDKALWLKTLNQAVSLLPEHLSCYQLTIEPRTPLGKRHAQGEFSLPSEDLQYDFFMMTSETLERADMTSMKCRISPEGWRLLQDTTRNTGTIRPILDWGRQRIPS